MDHTVIIVGVAGILAISVITLGGVFLGNLIRGWGKHDNEPAVD